MNSELMYFKELLEANNYKFTKQKQAVLKALIKSNIHLTVEEIYALLKKSVGLATVYRSIKAFKKLNIVKELNIDGINYYEMSMFSKKPLHIHFKCINCNSIIDIDNIYLNLDYLKLNNKLEKEDNLIIYDTNIMLLGLCNKCTEAKDGKTNKI